MNTRRKVLSHPGKADQAALLGAERSDDHVGPEPRSVLAEAPSLLLVPSLAGGHDELLLALAGSDVLGRAEHREVLPDDLHRFVTLGSLGTGVPRGHAPLGVEHEDRVVLYALDQKAKAVVAIVPVVLTQSRHQRNQTCMRRTCPRDRRSRARKRQGSALRWRFAIRSWRSANWSNPRRSRPP